ncbi:MAG: ATP-binding protein [Paracoccaceae bacterium]
MLPSIGYLFLVGLLAGGVWWWAYQNSLGQISQRGQTELALAADRIQSHLQRFRQLSVVLADHPGLIALLQNETDQFDANAQALLLKTADKTGSLEIFVLTSDGQVVASSQASPVLSEFGDTPFFIRAMNSALGTAQGFSQESGRIFFSAAPVKQRDGGPLGAIVVKVDIEAVETDWRASPNALYFVDSSNVVFVSNRRGLLFRSEDDGRTPARTVAQAVKYGDLQILAFPHHTRQKIGDFAVLRFSEGPFDGKTMLRLSRAVPVVELDARILIDTAPAFTSAMLQSAFAAAVSLVLGALLMILSQRRLALAQLLTIEETAKQELEARVERRTRQLSDANEGLRQAQQDLIQAGKLSALGQMSAGISHELNQPLMAIRSFAENAEQFLEQGDRKTTADNLSRISDLARRMGRIIKNLRTFSRKEGEPMTRVELNQVISAALELSEKRLEQAGVCIHKTLPGSPVWVMGGEVRLQQVLLNLLSNAIDAMEEQARKSIWISIDSTGPATKLTVRDNGPGLIDAEKIFDPFYSTKAVGKSEGMGLGLSISYGIVQSFGGQITGRNHVDGGATFTVNLNPADKETP